MSDPWEKAYAYGRIGPFSPTVAHVREGDFYGLCGEMLTPKSNRIPDPYPVCQNCLKTKRAKELGL